MLPADGKCFASWPIDTATVMHPTSATITARVNAPLAYAAPAAMENATAPAGAIDTIPFHGFHTWYQIVGEREDPGKLPLLCLHGGPGAAHDYLESLAAMAETGRRVIFYDQLGCGRSATPPNPSMWTVELYVEEVNA